MFIDIKDELVIFRQFPAVDLARRSDPDEITKTLFHEFRVDGVVFGDDHP